MEKISGIVLNHAQQDAISLLRTSPFSEDELKEKLGEARFKHVHLDDLRQWGLIVFDHSTGKWSVAKDRSTRN